VRSVLRYSVNTWDRGFLDKLYSSTNAVGVASDLVLSVLNTNVHVYGVSPALTVIEKTTSRQLARLFGYEGPRAGGFTTSGGSISNYTSLVIARNTLFPDTRINGNGNRQFALFTSEHGHYSVETAAQACGIGSSNVYTVPVDSAGRMAGAALQSLILRAKEQGKTPLYVNATAGTTVLGSYDSFKEISEVCKKFGIWMHIDGSWGGPVIFSAKQRHKLDGSHLADSITVNPHKMMVSNRMCSTERHGGADEPQNVPLSCSFLLGPDMSIFHQANTLPVGYLFHGDESDSRPSPGQQDAEVWDLAEYTLQCGRRGDSLKLALAWIYYGAAGFERRIEHAFDMAAYLAATLQRQSDFVLLSTNPPPCLQVCFYYAPNGKLADSAQVNTRRTKEITAALLHRGFMIDYAPGDRGNFFRVVVNSETQQDTMDRLVVLLQDIGSNF
jgi:glutamate decarboxylase